MASANGSSESTDSPKPRVVENFRPLKVIIIGAGFSGIYCGIRIPERLRNVELTIYDKNAGIGGTWFESRYPGCACDIPSHSYQYTFAPNPDWSGWYAPAPEILRYLESVVERFSVGRFVKTLHKVTDAKWDAPTSTWFVTVQNLTTGEVFVDKADVLINARGALNEPSWPDIPGVRDMKIPVLHSAAWDDSVDFKNKRIGVIGGGSSAIQIVPQLQRLPGTQLSCFVRSKTWIARPFAESSVAAVGSSASQFTPEERKRFAEDPEELLRVRTIVERDGNSIHAMTIKDSALQKLAQDEFAAMMKKKLAKKPHIFESLLPSFGVACRRLTPGPGYLEALAEDNVDFITTAIEKATKTGIVLTNGETRELDVLVCATGFQTTAPPPFPIIGKNGQTIQEKFTPHPETYLSLATDGFPNYFMMLGPNAAIGTGPLTTMIEKTGDYIVKCIRKIQKECISSIEPKSARVRDFSRIIDQYFKNTVYLDECSSWYKNKGGNRIIGVWPGSALHAMETLRSPRWEDFDYTYEEDKEGADFNRLAWLGDGWSAPQVDPNAGDLAYFVQPGLVDIPTEPLPEENLTFRRLAFSH